MAIYNFPTQLSGDSFDGVNWTLTDANGDPMPITDATVKIQFRARTKTGAIALELSEADGIALGGVDSNEITVNAINAVNLTPGIYYYDVEITFSDGSVKTYIEGTWTINQDTTR